MKKPDCEPGSIYTLGPSMIIGYKVNKTAIIMEGYLLDKATEVPPELIFAKKVRMCIHLLGAQSDLLSTVGSWRIDAGDEDTFDLLDSWIDKKLKEQKATLDYITSLHKE